MASVPLFYTRKVGHVRYQVHHLAVSTIVPLPCLSTMLSVFAGQHDGLANKNTMLLLTWLRVAVLRSDSFTWTLCQWSVDARPLMKGANFRVVVALYATVRLAGIARCSMDSAGASQG